MFESITIQPGVRHIRDAMGVCMTLLEGTDVSLLFDTGYGTEDVGSYVRTLTAKPLQVVLSHGHHDHALGAMWFDKVSLFAQDQPVFDRYTSATQREKVLSQAAGKGLTAPADYLARLMPQPDHIACTEKHFGFDAARIDLGELEVILLKVPGHTPGSAVGYLPSRRLLLTADDWNPCTWLWFDECLGVKKWRKHMQDLLAKAQFDQLLCSHQHRVYTREELASFLAFVTDEALLAAKKVSMGGSCDTRQLLWEPDCQLVFDYNKMEL